MHLRRCLFLFLAFLSVLGPPSLLAQKSGTITSTQCAPPIDVTQQSTVAIQVTGTWTGTLQPEISVQGQPAVNIQVTPSTSSTAQSSITANGVYQARVAGGSTFLVCGATVSSGTANVYVNASQGVAVNGGGGAAASVPFSGVTPGTNTGALVIGTGGSLSPSGTGSITATSCPGCTTTVPTLNLLASYPMTECSGTTINDTSVNGNNGTFNGTNIPTWVNGGNCTTGGVQFNGGQIDLPSALNAARTIVLVTQFTPPNTLALQMPLCGSTTTNWGAMFRSYQLNTSSNPLEGPNGGEYIIGGWSNQGQPYQMGTIQSAAGTQIVTWELGSAGDGTFDAIWVNDNLAPFVPVQPSLLGNLGFSGTPQSAGNQSAGHFVMGGSGAGVCSSAVSTVYNGIIYAAAFYSDYKTPSQLGQIYAALGDLLTQRNILPSYQNWQAAGISTAANRNNQYVAVGDSITDGSTVATQWTQYIGYPGGQAAWNWADIGLPSSTALQQTTDAIGIGPASWFYPNGALNVATVWLGTNDCEAGATGQQAYANLAAAVRNYRVHVIGIPYKLLGISMLSRTSIDTCKNALNLQLRQSWRSLFDGFVDAAADPNLGADGASANTAYFTDGTHPTTNAQANDIALMVGNGLGAMFGNNDWSSANLYTAGAPAATAITAASETGNTMTFTSALNPPVGSCVQVSGVTPSTYNTGGSNPQCWNPITTSGTNFTAWNNATGLGAGTVFGTAVIPLQVAQDVYVRLGGSAASPSFTLRSCQGFTGQNLYFKNENTASPWVLTPFSSAETIDGAASFTMPGAASGNYPVIALQAQLVSPGAGGCVWKTIQGAALPAVINAATGFQIAGAAPNNHVLLGNGTNYVDAATVPNAALPAALTATSLALTDASANTDLSETNSTASTSLTTPVSSPLQAWKGAYWGFTSPTNATPQSNVDTVSLQDVPGNSTINATISNCAETASNIVTLTITGGTFLQAQDVALSGLTTCTWLNQTVGSPGYGLLFGTGATALVFYDPTQHGTQASTAETGSALFANAVITESHTGTPAAVHRFVNEALSVNSTVPGSATSENFDPGTNWTAFYWNGSTSLPDTFNFQHFLGQGTNAPSAFLVAHAGSTGTPTFAMPAGMVHGWSLNFTTGLTDTGLSRDAAATLDLGNGAFQDKSGTLNLQKLTATGTVSGATYKTATNCSSSASPAVCGASPAGSVAIAAAATTVTVNTSAVTANSQIFVFADDSLGAKLSVTCNSTLATIAGGIAVTARTAATSFQISTLATVTTNPLCLSYLIVN